MRVHLPVVRISCGVLLSFVLPRTVVGSQVLATGQYDRQGQFVASEPCTTFTFTIAHAGSHAIGDILLAPWPAPFQWENGFSGSFDLTTGLDVAPFFSFSRMIESVTDGVDEPMFFDGSVSGCNQLLPHSPFILESTVFKTPSDLIGNNIDFIRVIINNLQIEQIGTTTSYDLSVSYEFWGTPVPEPGTIGLLGVGGIGMLRRCRRRGIEFRGNAVFHRESSALRAGM